MKNNWLVKKLGRLIILNYGKGISEGDRKVDGLFPIYGANGELGRTDRYLVEGEAIVVGRKGSAGEVTRVSGKFWPSDVTYYVFGNKQVDIDFLFYLLKNLNLKRFARGVKPGINRNDVYNLEILLPGIEEQKRIVKKLEKILAKIEETCTLRQESKKEIQAVIRSALKKTFDDLSKKYDKKEIKDFGEVKGGKRLPAGHSFASLPTEYPYLRVVDFKDYSIDTTNMKYLGVATQQEISRYTISDKDSYISIAGTIGTVGTIPPQLSGANLTENAAKIVFNREAEVNNRFIVYFLDSPQGKDAIKKRTNQVGQPKLALMRIETVEVPLPNLKEQEKIVAYLDSLSEKVRALQKLQQEQLQELEALQQSVLHQAFQRELSG